MEPQDPNNPTPPAEVIPADPVPADQSVLAPVPTPEPPPGPTLAEQFPRLAAMASDEGKQKELDQYDAETVRLVNDQMDMVSAAEERHEAAKKAAGEAKREWEAEDTKLHQLIRERRDARGKPRQRSLLDLVPDDPDSPPEVGVVPDAPPADPTETLWQQFPLARFTQFGLTEADIEKLTTGRRKRGLSAVPLATVGDMARYTAGDPNSPGSRQELSDFDGIGPSKATVIDDALERFWAWWGSAGRVEFARDMGVELATGNPVEPGPAVPGDGGQDPGVGDQQPAGEPLPPGAGDHGIEHHNAAVAFGFTGGAFVTPERLAAHQRDRANGTAGEPADVYGHTGTFVAGEFVATAVEDVPLPKPADEPAEPDGGPDVFELQGPPE
jgi:hypothetical protein